MLSVVLAAIGLAVGLIYFLKNRTRKTLDYVLINDVNVLSDGVGNVREDIVVTVGNAALKEPRIITVRYINTGTKGIVADDFLNESITTTAESGAVNSQLVGKSDRDIAVTESGAVPHKRYVPDCLNPGDYLDIQYILETNGLAPGAQFDPVCRIRDATRPGRFVNLVGQNVILDGIDAALRGTGLGPIRVVVPMIRIMRQRKYLQATPVEAAGEQNGH